MTRGQLFSNIYVFLTFISFKFCKLSDATFYHLFSASCFNLLVTQKYFMDENFDLGILVGNQQDQHLIFTVMFW